MASIFHGDQMSWLPIQLRYFLKLLTLTATYVAVRQRMARRGAIMVARDDLFSY